MLTLYTSWIPAVILTLLAAWWTYASYRRYKLNAIIAAELDVMIKSTINTIGETKKKIAEQSTVDIMSQPEMLASIVTVLINKYGDTRLSLKDFMLSDDEYVSVYVDTTTEEIILSLNSHLGSSGGFSMAKFGSNDDNTFH